MALQKKRFEVIFEVIDKAKKEGRVIQMRPLNRDPSDRTGIQVITIHTHAATRCAHITRAH